MRRILKIIFLIILIFPPGLICAQVNSEELKDVFNDGEYFLMSEDYPEALNAYLKVYEYIPENANLNYRIGLCYLNIPRQKTQAIPYLEFACNHISSRYTESSFNETRAPAHSLFLLATAYQINNDFDLAKLTFEEYKSFLKVNDVYEIDFVNHQIRSCELAKKLIREPVKIEIGVLSDLIPKEKPSYNPVLSADGNTLVYLTEERFYKAIWMVKKEEGIWTEPVNITSQIQSDGDCQPTSISYDGTTLYMAMINNYGADIYISYYNDGIWTPKEKMGKPINSRFWETHATISRDGKTLYFTSNRNGGMGGLDIYRSQLDKNGKWGDAENLGSVINTPYNEESPFVIGYGKILYFSSQGHDGMGGFDIFKSVAQPDGSWSLPINIGFPINCADDDLFYYPVEDNKTALYAGPVQWDEEFTAIKEIRINPVKASGKILMNGELYTEDESLLSKDAIVFLSDLNKNTTDTLRPDPENGMFSLEIFPGIYRMIASARGYDNEKQIIYIADDYQRTELDVALWLTPVGVSSGEYYVIKNINFDFNSTELKREAQLELERLYGLMERYPELSIEVTGHTDSHGTPVYNLELSRKRADSVIEYLVAKGIDPERFVSRGAGETENIAANIKPDGSDNPEGRQLNRNATIKILKSDNPDLVIEPAPIPDYLKPPAASSYTILLVSAENAVPNEKFSNLYSITQEEVKESFYNSTYLYSIGTFFSEVQAEEVMNSFPFRDFPEAKVIRKSEISKASTSTSIISSPEEGNFAIQIFALKTPVEPGKFSHLGDVMVRKYNDGLYRVIYGNYETHEDAESDLPDVKKRGFEDAFIVELESKRISTVKDTLLKTEAENFTIQLKALRSKLPPDYFSPISGISEIKGRDDLFRYIYGEFGNIKSAESELEKLRKKGFNDAFIRKISSIPGQ